ncbi:phage antirepressor N-terminal domain-containing protein [Pseudomonas aeruginosa]|uniref:phage antirepressor N-terminal domain-containing protein n=1 Tax=Pseudomonas aeruginosa TaxID=287 RepID=UPI00227120E7|nr:phage antirepressor N-terminal domain-containing protein [Pseudomonas aeruginosa]MCY0368101.1 phage antirepressor N-terminal domain-containing protein [Pseudomonas aeruginosa]MCY0375398.1 phage antirepressor N-terminal domain-containing protein [Pseudomonas aeruginosa]
MGKNSGHEKAPVLAGAEALGNEINFGEEIVMGDNSTAASSVIPFRSAKLLLVERDGQPFVPMKPVVEGMGLDWKSQHAKLQGGRFNSVMVMITTTGADGKQYEMACLPLRKLAGWLMSIHASKVRPELRQGVIDYQNECDDVLWAYWNEGAAVRRDDRTAASVLATTIGTDGFHCLAAIVDGKVRHLPSAIRRGAKNHIWSQVHKAFSVVTAEDIPVDQLDSARNFIAAYALEGEWLPKDKAASAVDTCSWSNIAFLVDCVEKCWKIVESRRLATHLSGLGCNAGVELAGFLWDGLGSAAHVRKYCAKQLNWPTRASA